MLTLEDLLGMDAGQLQAVMDRGHALEPEALAETQYLGVDLSMPRAGQWLLWQTFRKTFHHDAEEGELRGWNVRMEQTGVRGEAIPMRDRKGGLKHFGHYRVRSARGKQWPRDWKGANFLDYGTAGNPAWDLARFGYTPLVAVNEGSMDLLLGWEVFKVGRLFLPVPLYWALELQGPLEEVVGVPGRG